MMHAEIITPLRLRPGQTIGICSPGAPVSEQHKERLFAGLRILEWFSVHTKTAARTVGEPASVQARLDDLHSLWRDPDVRMIAFSQCEDSTGDLLSGLDYDLFRRDPKIVLGPPGATTILNAIHARSGLVTYLGTDLVWGMGRKLAAPIRDNFIDTFFAGANASIHARRRWDHLEDDSIDNPGWHMLSSGEATGRILGGNLTSFVRLLELGMAPSHEASLLVLEDTLSELKDAAYIKQLLNTLEERGVFKEVKGVILGWFDGPSTLRDQVDATIRAFVADRCVPNGIPVLQITDLGHNVENFVFPIGSEATLNATSLEVVIMNNQT